MQKITFIIIALALYCPFSLYAQDIRPPSMPDATIYAAISRFNPAYCNDGIKGLAKAVDTCYQNTNDTSPAMDQCILGDMTIGRILLKTHQADPKILDKKPSDILLDKNILVEGEQSYLNLASILKRSYMLSFLPRFRSSQEEEILPYLKQGLKSVYDGTISNCKH
ncbi:hypothetical protein [Commensalibacter oyaizuii]|uniref:Uncharacterized protein n=1 Tax=Commensalibacter oyaizuii TaxID=3043873 RepID=A0ABT6Q355_9PROT|nr:hypothetical protein [Commensalibacter sp. TBRC 16381]MDI2091566.1 hypothetical protein [Commensalibacter sp. TBRC 16381]